MEDTLTEPELLGKIAAGDRIAFSTLYQLHLSEIYHYLYLFTKSTDAAEEIVQDVFVKIWEKRENLIHIKAFKPYLYKCAKNMLLDEFRRNAVKSKVYNALKPDTEESHGKTDDRIIYNEYHKIAEMAIDLLPEKRKAIFLMRTREELSLDEIAERLGISKSVVKKQLYAGIGFVRQYLHNHDAYFMLIAINLYLNTL
ncbi:RNA polymerase sigma factor [Pedobacter hiemivivus]|uniref:RNA polymerase sigma-70 factor n=1 Tax=Pedobacter hiemivivus TaxID=2530454 RepID=A0A4R0MKF9_9SPHI|nr:RNA polymerase sigma-70 factor [Pedobacter hiemivivus]TCC87099.1 RNA polymerase sigma-70 factor [Pedobacter hiemivivus]